MTERTRSLAITIAGFASIWMSVALAQPAPQKPPVIVRDFMSERVESRISAGAITVDWAPSGRQFAVSFRWPETPPRIVGADTGVSRPLQTRGIDKRLRGYSGRTYGMQWLSNSEYLLSLGLANVSTDDYASFFFKGNVLTNRFTDFVATAGHTAASFDPSRNRLVFCNYFDSVMFQWAELKPSARNGILPDLANTDIRWPRIQSTSSTKHPRILLGNFVTLTDGKFMGRLSPHESQSPFAQVGISDAQTFIQKIGRPVGEATYLPAIRHVGFVIGKGMKEGGNADWTQDGFTLGLAPLPLRTFTEYKLLRPKNLRFFGNGWPSIGVRWVQDGRSIYLRHKDHNELWRLDIRTGKAYLISRHLPGYPLQAWPSPKRDRVAILYGGITYPSRDKPHGICILQLPRGGPRSS